MKIVPVVCKIGVHYRVVKRTLFGKRYLSTDGIWTSTTDRIGMIFHRPMMFDSPAHAVREIRKQFGDTADIDVWEGKA